MIVHLNLIKLYESIYIRWVEREDKECLVLHRRGWSSPRVFFFYYGFYFYFSRKQEYRITFAVVATLYLYESFNLCMRQRTLLIHNEYLLLPFVLCLFGGFLYYPFNLFELFDCYHTTDWVGFYMRGEDAREKRWG